MSPLLALLSAVTFGAADFLGGVATRQSERVLAVVVLSQLAGLTIVLVVLAAAGGELIREDIGWAAGAGVAGSAGLVLLYRGLGIGTMSVVAPLSAMLAAVVPVVWGLSTGERPSTPALIGVPLALVAIALVSGARVGSFGRGPGVAEGIGAGVGFGFFFILIANSESAELWTLTFARIASISVIVAIALLSKASLKPGRGTGWFVLGAGVLDMAANLLFLMAERRGLLTLVAVITALYPASTVILAQFVLHERLVRTQIIGLLLAAVGVGLISLG
ncbi:MAG: DMT family transporter [Acidimicrobiia bacterium]|nr:DMT family transporter [Acidimicrobiia bacterium]NNL12197.1 EamA family transporter [Acidimicrobiia bacterium]